MADNHETHSHPPYGFIFFLLCGFTALSWIADESKDMMPNAATLAVVVLAIAVMKATCVLLYFMHLKFERAWKYILLAPTTILALGLPLALLPDIGVHYYDIDVPQSPISDHAFDGSDIGSGAGAAAH
ncbi:MAG: cytochrome C oxidase subunit IV family protein [Planctomycetota bacterium]|jgi:cytochrome c oxidase subunit 4